MNSELRKSNITDTIAAIATPPGEGGIAVVRLSGKESFGIAGKIFYRDKGLAHGFDPASVESHTVHFGYIAGSGGLLDEGLLTLFKSPHSYTGEDVVEISCHGGSYIASKLLTKLIGEGARLATPGEFTKRAFLNGKLDLSQAEAVADLIRSKTESAHSSSLRQLEGELSGFVKQARAELIRITSLVELELDFAEEGLEFVGKEEILKLIETLSKRITEIISSYIAGKIIREGVTLVIAGKPNSGKSSLFNKLLAQDRAIVSGIPGTTRDYLEESVVIEGVLFRLTDTAGIRTSGDEIESEGIQRSFKKIADADLTLYLIDSQTAGDDLKLELQNFSDKFSGTNAILVFSKSDLGGKAEHPDGVRVSVYVDASVNDLKKIMKAKAFERGVKVNSSEIILTNFRHKQCLENVLASLESASRSAEEGMSGEFISVDLRSAMSHLGEITGEVTNDEILNNIFSSFCIGK